MCSSITESLEVIGNSLYIFIIPIGTILYACAKDVGLIFPKRQSKKKDETQEMTTENIPLILIFSSIFLILIYKFPKLTISLLRFIFLISLITSSGEIINDWIYYITKSKYSSAISFILSLLNTMNWFFTKNSLALNTSSIFLCIYGIITLKVNKLQTILIISITFLLYDVWWVFLSPIFFGKSVMIETAVRAVPSLPLAISTPQKWKPGPKMLGNGDIFLPGIMLNFFIRYDMKHQSSSTFLFGIIGYGIGLIMAFLSSYITKSGQPALLYLNPMVVLMTFSTAYFQGNLSNMWNYGALNSDESEEELISNEKGSLGAEFDEKDEEKIENSEET